jgi:hypothetical protein
VRWLTAAAGVTHHAGAAGGLGTVAGPLVSVSDGTSRARPAPGRPFLIRSPRGNSHAGPGGQQPSFKTAKKVTGHRRAWREG